MGRGASRGKSGGMIVMKDAERKIVTRNENESIFQLFYDGCFEKDFKSYCSNRLNEYSCVHWLDPVISESDHLTQVAHMNNSLVPGYVNVEDVSYCFHDRQAITMVLMQFNKYFLPLTTVLALAGCVLTLVTLRRVLRLHPLALYLVHIAVMDVIEVLVRGGDAIFISFGHLRVLSALQIISRSSCQMLPFTYNLFKHCQMSMYVALAIDNWRFLRAPRLTSERYKPEWIRNVVIVIVAILITLNSQFFWTFDVTENDNLILHDRFVKNTFECSFSKTWPLKQVFTEFIWPLADHFTGEVLPTIVSLYFGYLTLRITRPLEPHNLSKYIIKFEQLFQLNRAILIITIVFGFTSLPRCIFYLFKFAYFYYMKSTNIQSKEAVRSRLMSVNTLIFSSRFYGHEAALQIIEFSIGHLSIIFLIVKFVVLYSVIGTVRSRTNYLLSLSCNCLRHQQSQVRVVSQYLCRQQHPDNKACSICHEKQCRNPQHRPQQLSADEITFKHKSVSFRNPKETVTLCSYNM